MSCKRCKFFSPSDAGTCRRHSPVVVTTHTATRQKNWLDGEGATIETQYTTATVWPHVTPETLFCGDGRPQSLNLLQVVRWLFE